VNRCTSARQVRRGGGVGLLWRRSRSRLMVRDEAIARPAAGFIDVLLRLWGGTTSSAALSLPRSRSRSSSPVICSRCRSPRARSRKRRA
jgi:hypothetical protein